MNIQQLIQQQTGVTDPQELEGIETVLRQDIFKSTLDWQTREQLVEGIAQAHQLHQELKVLFNGGLPPNVEIHPAQQGASWKHTSQPTEPAAGALSRQECASSHMADFRLHRLLTVSLAELSVESRQYLEQGATRSAETSLLVLRHPHGLMVYVPPVPAPIDPGLPRGLRDLHGLARAHRSSWLSVSATEADRLVDEVDAPSRRGRR